MIRMRIILAALSLLVFATPTHSARANSETIAAIINEDIVSRSDLNDRMRLIMVSSNLADTPEIRARLTPQVINSLIEEEIKMQEAEHLELKVLQDEIDRGFKTIADQNKLTPDQFKQVLDHNKINIETIYRQIRAQLAWSKVVQAKVRPRIIVSDNDIQNMLERLQNSIGQTEYLVAEIYLPFENAEDEKNMKLLAENLIAQMQAGKAPFFKLAQQFSNAPGAANGGDLGWIQAGQMPKEVDAALAKMDTGQLSEPIHAQDGYRLVLLRDKREILEENFPSEDQIRDTIGAERLDRAQRRYYLDLKAAAFIENRLES